MVQDIPGIEDLTPALWFDCLDSRLADQIKPRTLNGELAELQYFLRLLADEGRAICHRMLQVQSLDTGTVLPRDVPVDQLRLLLSAIEAETTAARAEMRRIPFRNLGPLVWICTTPFRGSCSR